jgi:putative secretion ATPase (PEP-CTERM system associated)
MYNEFYHFKEKPFSLTPDPEFLYRSRAHKRALAYLEYGIQDPSGFVCITGEIGTGKTTLLRTFLNQLDKSIRVARIFNTKVTSRQLLEMILHDLDIEYRGKSKAEMINALNHELIDTFAKGKRVALLIDEAQNLDVELLEEIRLLSNLETEKTKLLQIILVGQSELRDHLQLPSLEQFRQRITINYHLSPLSLAETAAYIVHRLQVASTQTPLRFPEPVVRIIHKYSRGVPRLINVIADSLLLYGFVEEKKQHDLAMIEEVISDMIQDGTLLDPDKKRPVTVEGLKDPNRLLEVMGILKDRIDQLENKQALFEESLKGMNGGSQLGPMTELLERLEGVHFREQQLAVQYDRLKNREEALKRREQVVRDFISRIQKAKGQKLRVEGRT